MTKRYRPFHPLSYQGLQSLNEAFAELQRRDVAREAAKVVDDDRQAPALVDPGAASDDHHR